MLDLIRQRAQSTGVKIVFAVIIIVFVFWGVGNMNSAGPNVVATVNGQPILARDFMAAIQAQENQIRAMVPDFSAEDMRSLNLPQQSLQMLVSRSLVAQEAKKLGMTVTPVELLAAIRTIPDFRGPDGKFDQAVYEAVLKNNGRDVAQFEQDMMRDMLGEKMRDFVSAAVSVTPDEAKRRFSFQAERRTISYVLFPITDYSNDITITDDAIKAYYDTNQAQFSNPATTAVAYIEMTPSVLAPNMEVSDEEITAAYNKGPSRYNLRQILTAVPANADAAAEDAIKTRLGTFATALTNGKPFEEVAEEAAKDETTAGGELGWVDARQLPEDVLGALAGLKKNGVTPVLRTGDRYSVFQLIETDPDYALPEAEIKAAIRTRLAEDKATLHFRDVQAQAEDFVAEGKSLADIAKELKVDIKNTKAVPPQDLAYVLGLRKPAQASAITGPKGTLVSAILETREGFLVAEITEQNAAGISPLEDVKDVIREVLVRREAEKKAEEAARIAMPEIEKGEGPLKDKLVTSEPFGRSGEIPELGFSKALADAVFSSPIGEWLKTPFATPKGAVIVMPAESVPLNDEEWNRVQDRVVQGLLEAKRSQAFTAFIADLGRNAEVRVTNPQLIEQLQQ
ncbi:MAG: Peptidyl-prolyl cis-trans isomerase D [Desulfovibrio sp.]